MLYNYAFYFFSLSLILLIFRELLFNARFAVQLFESCSLILLIFGEPLSNALVDYLHQ